MSKKKAKAAPAAAEGGAAAPKKRSKLKLVLFALMPLVGAGGGYAGWLFFGAALLGGEAAHGTEAAAAEHAGEHAQDGTHVSAIPPEVAAETSATYSFALSELLRKDCGAVKVAALRTASEAEARTDGALVNLSWMAASRRADSITAKSCNRILVEIDMAEAKAARTAAGEGEEKAAGHH